MSIRPDILTAIALVGLVSYACRASGYLLMRYITPTPRVLGVMQAIPMALVGAILGPIAATGGPPEWAGLVTAAGLMWATGRDFISIFGSMAMVAALRALL